MNRLTPEQIEENTRLVRERQLEHIKKFGFAIMSVFKTAEQAAADPSPNFAYTIGNYQKDLPELFVIGNLGQQSMADLMHDVINYWKEQGHIVLGSIPIQAYPGGHLRLQLVQRGLAQDKYTLQVENFKGDTKYEVVQVIWPDNDGHFPDSPKYNQTLAQPILPSIAFS